MKLPTLLLSTTLIASVLCVAPARAGERADRIKERAETKRENNEKDGIGAAKREKHEIARDKRQIADDKRDLKKDIANGDKDAAREDAKQLRDDRKDLNDDRKDVSVDQRQANQARRIAQGVRSGALTPDELTQLRETQKNIREMEDLYKGDGKLNLDELKQLQQALGDASRSIFSEKHDADGNATPYRWNESVVLKDDVIKKMTNPATTKAEARALVGGLHEALNLKQQLATGNLAAEQRADLQAKYDALVNQYYQTK